MVTSGGAAGIVYLPFRILLRIITPVYQYFSRQHLRKRLRRRSGGWRAKVISVGNISLGGSGKTPIIIYLANYFLSQGKRVAVVHSGYGRSCRREILIEAGERSIPDVEEVGDEVAMMAARLPGVGFAVGSDKKAMVDMADDKLDPGIILIDDGFQRLDIAKDIDIAVVDANLARYLASGCGGGAPRLFPAGYLREKPSALTRADAVYVTRHEGTTMPESIPSVIEKYNNRALVVEWEMTIREVEFNGEVKPLDILSDKRPFLFAGIGSFPRLLRMVEKAGVPTMGWHDCGDHCRYDRKLIEKINTLAQEAGADCYLTTAKDMVKLSLSQLNAPVYSLRLSVRPGDERQFETMIGNSE